jgi:stearoyl-CoA desaturase (delta-9 desaturase)
MAASWVNAAGFWLVQLSAFSVFLVPFDWPFVVLCMASHVVRAIGLTLAYHRYFAHRAFQMHRVTRFVWTLLGCAAMQKGPLWWAGHHIDHHRFADRDRDPHSPRVRGFCYAHVGWFLDQATKRVPASNPVVRDFARYPELRLLDRYFFVPPALLALGLYLGGGWPWVAWGFCLPTVTLAHATFSINTINHLYGSRRFATPDDSTNNPLTAFFAVGEGWHNNHHRYQRAARNGFYWWEFDPTYYVIRAMATVGLAWDLQPVPARVYAEADEVRRRAGGAQRAPAVSTQVSASPQARQ